MGCPVFSPNGRLMAGLMAREKSSTAWILDTRTAAMLRIQNVRRADDYEIAWRRGRFDVLDPLSRRVLARLGR